MEDVPKLAAVVCPKEKSRLQLRHASITSTTQLISNASAIVPPDGGYGYVILFAAFTSSMVVDGVTYSFGPLKDSIIEKHPDLEQATLAWIGSVLAGVYLFTGPLVSAMANKLGFRVVAVFGSVISSLAFILSWYLNRNGLNMGALIVIYGIVGGIGFSCIYVPSVVAVGFYFKKKRALATGIAVCGSGVGNFIFPPLIQFLAELYDWHGAILGLGIIVTLCGFMGLLYKPLKPQMTTSSQETINESEGLSNYYIENTQYAKNCNVTDNMPDICNLTEEVNSYQQPSSNFVIIPFEKEEEMAKSSSLESSTQENFTNVQSESTLCNMTTSILDFTLWNSPVFIVFCLGCMFMLLGMLVPFVYLTDQARYILRSEADRYDTHSLTLLISLIGAANIVGRVASGWLADRSCINALALNNVSIAVMGISTVLLPFLRQYYQLAVYSCLFGLSMACGASLRSVLLVELLGLDKLTDAYGFVLLFEGVASTISTPLAGTIVRMYGKPEDFSVAFYVAGGFMLVSACLFFQIDRIQSWQRNRQSDDLSGNE